MRVFAVTLLCLTYCSWLGAVEVQQGTLYPAGTLVESNEAGAAFTIPPGWQGAWPAGSQFFVLESQSLQASLFMTFDQVSKSQVKQLMAATIPLDAGLALTPTAKTTDSDGILTGDYHVSGQPALQGFVAARELRPGFSLAVIALSQQSSKQKVNVAVEELVRSVEVRQVKAPPRDTSNGGQSWQEYLRGRYIARFYTGSDYGEKEELWLCSDGTFYRAANSGGFSMSGASGASQSQGLGRWKAEGSVTGRGTLSLQFGQGASYQGSGPGFEWSESGPGGDRWTYQLTLNNSLYLDGNKWLRGKNEYCR